jgi:hypothetical protein
MERWLAPSNFDPDGMAKTSLSALMAERGPQPPGLMPAKQHPEQDNSQSCRSMEPL